MLRKITCNRTRKLIAIKQKSLFIPIRLHSVAISGYILEAHSTSSSLKKKMEGVCAKEKEEGRMRRGKKEKEKERMKGRRRKGKR